MNFKKEIEARSTGRKLPIITKCKMCNSSDLRIIRNIICEDIMTNVEVTRDVIECKDCECIHYYNEDKNLCYEFTPTVLKSRNMEAAKDY